MATNLAELYDRDFYAWALSQADELRQLAEARPNLPIDFEHLIAEIEGLAVSDLNTVLSQLQRLTHHLLKLEHSPSPGPRRGWLNSVDEARSEIERHFSESMRVEVEGRLDRLHKVARRLAARDLLSHHENEAGAAARVADPYALDQLIDESWYPSNRHGLIDRD